MSDNGMATAASRIAPARAQPLHAVRALFLSYDGLTDPLGQSQVLPYVRGLVQHGAGMHVVSFEKPSRFRQASAEMRRIVDDAGIQWTPLRYTKRPPVVSAIWDLIRLWRTALRLHSLTPFDVVHCRSYLPALIGMRLKRRFGVRFLFDMRGFWADERVDAGLWPQWHPLYRAIYRFFKAREAEFLAEADAIVSLTHTAVADLEARRAGAAGRTRVIPCSVDYSRFDVPAAATREAARRALGIPDTARVAAYVGSCGTWYMMAEMMAFFRALLGTHPDARFLVITPDTADTALRHAAEAGVPRDRVIVRTARHAEVPALLAAADFGLFFIRASWSKRSSSPTKLAEYLAMGLPVVTNAGIGDVEVDVSRFRGGVVVHRFTPDEYARVLAEMTTMLARPRSELRDLSREVYALEGAVESYVKIYHALAGTCV